MFDFKNELHDISLKRKLYFDHHLIDSELNLMEIEILIFLKNFPENNTFTEIMKSKGYAKSYVSKAIGNLVQKRYLEKKSAINNKKVFNLYLLEKSNDIIRQYEECMQLFMQDAYKGITKKEMQQLEETVRKISENLT